MSIDRCQICAAYVDTDLDEDAYHLTARTGDQLKQEFCRCASCRLEAVVNLQSSAPPDPHP